MAPSATGAPKPTPRERSTTMDTTDQPSAPLSTPTADAARDRRPAGRWVKRWRDEIEANPVAPGVYRRKAGGFVVRAMVPDPRTGKRVEVYRTLPDAKRPRDASATLAA